MGGNQRVRRWCQVPVDLMNSVPFLSRSRMALGTSWCRFRKMSAASIYRLDYRYKGKSLERCCVVAARFVTRDRFDVL